MEAELPEPVPRNLLTLVFAALGPEYAILLAVAGVTSFILAALIVIRGRGPLASAALLLVVSIPILIGVLAALHGAIASYMVIAMSDVPPKPADVAEGTFLALLGPVAGFVAGAPGFAVALIGTLTRAFSSDAPTNQ